MALLNLRVPQGIRKGSKWQEGGGVSELRVWEGVASSGEGTNMGQDAKRRDSNWAEAGMRVTVLFGQEVGLLSCCWEIKVTARLDHLECLDKAGSLGQAVMRFAGSGIEYEMDWRDSARGRDGLPL